MPESVLHALAEHPEKKHVPQDVEQVTMQEHRRKNGQRLVVGRDESKAVSDVFNGSRRPSGQKDQGIRENQRINNPGVMLDRESTFERDDKHDPTRIPMTPTTSLTQPGLADESGAAAGVMANNGRY